MSFVACFSQLGQATGTIYSLNEFFTPRPWGCRHVRPVRQLGVNLPKTAGQKHKQYPRFQVEIRGISFHLFPQVAGGFAFLPYAATLCGTQRMEIRCFKKPFGYSHSVASILTSRHCSCIQFSVPSRAECRQVSPCHVSSASGTKSGTTSKTGVRTKSLTYSVGPDLERVRFLGHQVKGERCST